MFLRKMNHSVKELERGFAKMEHRHILLESCVRSFERPDLMTNGRNVVGLFRDLSGRQNLHPQISAFELFAKTGESSAIQMAK